MSARMSDVDPDKLKAYSFLLFSKLEGAMTSGMVHLGDKLGLYHALADRARRRMDRAGARRRDGPARTVGTRVGAQPGRREAAVVVRGRGRRRAVLDVA